MRGNVPITFIRGGWPDKPKPRHCYLAADKWDDYGYKTTFEPLLVDDDGEHYELGAVKIIQRGMDHGRTEFDAPFAQLDATYCSLGQSQGYYEQLAAIPYDLQQEFLIGLRDCIEDAEIFAEFQSEQSFGTSLLRVVTVDQLRRFREVLNGQLHPTAFHFIFTAKPENAEPVELDVRVKPLSTPPTNIHVLIGRNGVGKTRIIGGLERAVLGVEVAPGYAIPGQVRFPGDTEGKAYFSNLITVAFSAFDRFEPIEEKESRDGIRYSYVGLRLPGDLQTPPRLKTQSDLTQEFSASLRAALSGVRRRRWLEVIDILNSDPLFADLGLDQLTGVREGKFKRIMDDFDHLSSGHKIVLLTVTRLVEFVEERTLVLMDEPESHLHPPLLSSFIRAVSWLLTLRNGVALVATHSPVVLQEVPRSCVSIVRRSGNIITVDRPEDETFGENVGSLTDDIFELRVTESGFYSILRQHVDDGEEYDAIMEEFDDQIGAEGRAILRAMVLERDRGR
jgi:hypothetical protein